MRIIKFPELRFGHTVFSYLQLNSTQDKAKELSKDTDNEGAVVVARTQTQGRGRKDEWWVSDAGGLYFSLIYKSPKPIVEVGDFTQNLALYTANAIERVVAVKYTVNLEVRGINDIYLNNRKLAGIIVETESFGQSDPITVNPYIIGFGVNVEQKQFPMNLSKIPTSLLIETGYRFSRYLILKEICKELSVKL